MTLLIIKDKNQKIKFEKVNIFNKKLTLKID